MVDVYPPLEEASVALLALSVLTFTLAYVAVEIMKALHFERKDYQAKFFKQLLELIDAVDFSGKQRDFLPGEITPARQLVKDQPSGQKQLALIKFANVALDYVDNAWAFSVNKTAQTLNFGIIRPAKWSQAKVRTIGSKVYEQANLGVGVKLSNQIERGKIQVKTTWNLLFQYALDLMQLGIVQPLTWGRSKAQSALSFINERVSFRPAISSGLRKNKNI